MQGARGASLTKAQREEELRQFFEIATELRNPDTPDARLLECLDDVQVIFAHTPSATLRRRCFELVAELYDPDQKQSDGTA